MNIPFALAVLTAPAPAPDAEAKALWDQGEFEAAAAEWGRVYEETGLIVHLYSRGQAELMAGRCKDAIETFEVFIATGPNEQWSDAAQASIDECKEALPPQPEPVPVPAEPKPGSETQAKVPPPSRKVPDEAPPPRPWFRDPAGATLVGLGTAGLVAGTVLAIVAVDQQSRAEDSATLPRFARHNDRAVTLSRASVPVLAVGGALLIGGVIRYVIVAGRQRGGSASRPTALTWRF